MLLGIYYLLYVMAICGEETYMHRLLYVIEGGKNQTYFNVGIVSSQINISNRRRKVYAKRYKQWPSNTNMATETSLKSERRIDSMHQMSPQSAAG
jgi:hypothetical protein